MISKQLTDREMYSTLPVTFRLDSLTLGESIWARYRALCRNGFAREVHDTVERIVKHKFSNGEVKTISIRYPRISFVHPGGDVPDALPTTKRRRKKRSRSNFDIRASNAVNTGAR